MRYLTAAVCVACAMCLFPKPGESTICYVCDQTVDGCGLVFRQATSAAFKTQSDCNYCTKTYWNIGGQDHVKRDCTKGSVLETRCVDATIEGVGVGGIRCACNSDFCNAAPDVHPSAVATTLGLAFGLLLYFAF